VIAGSRQERGVSGIELALGIAIGIYHSTPTRMARSDALTSGVDRVCQLVEKRDIISGLKD
jgi:hypothetical protein